METELKFMKALIVKMILIEVRGTVCLPSSDSIKKQVSEGLGIEGKGYCT